MFISAQEPGDHVLDVHTPDLVLVAPSSEEAKPKPAKNKKKKPSRGSKGSRGSPDHVS